MCCSKFAMGRKKEGRDNENGPKWCQMHRLGHRYLYFYYFLHIFWYYILVLHNVLLHKVNDDENGRTRRRACLEPLLPVGVFIFYNFLFTWTYRHRLVDYGPGVDIEEASNTDCDPQHCVRINTVTVCPLFHHTTTIMMCQQTQPPSRHVPQPFERRRQPLITAAKAKTAGAWDM